MEPFSTVVIGDISNRTNITKLTKLTSIIFLNYDIIIHIGEPSAEVAKQNTSSTDEVVVATDPPVTATNTEPCLDLSLGIGFEKPVLVLFLS